jgi:hypothetical protein
MSLPIRIGGFGIKRSHRNDGTAWPDRSLAGYPYDSLAVSDVTHHDAAHAHLREADVPPLSRVRPREAK